MTINPNLVSKSAQSSLPLLNHMGKKKLLNQKVVVNPQSLKRLIRRLTDAKLQRKRDLAYAFTMMRDFQLVI